MSFISKIELQTAYLPDVLINPSAPSSGTGLGKFLLTILKPKITVNTSLGTQTYAPYGEPGPTRWPLLMTASLLVSVATIGIYYARK